MYGLGLLKGLGLTLKHFFDSYTEDLRWLGSKYTTPTFGVRQGAQARGIFTVEYPDEKLAVPERFRFVPFLVVNNYDDPYAPGDDWCTSCGICAKVCPPQCIWIVRGTDPETGRPKPQPEAFFIDIDICMNCGYCAEYCPFDAIKMDHDYELASYDRTTHHIYDKKKLSKEFRYWQMLAPTRVWEEAQRRGHWEHKDVEKLAKKAGVTLPEPSEANMHRATTVLPEDHQRTAAAAPTARPAAAAGAPALAATTTATRSGDARADVKNESLPMPLRAQAAIQARDESSGEGKKYNLVPEERKAISAVQKFAKEQGLTLEELAAQSVDAMPAVAAPVAQAAAPVVEAVAAAAPVAAAPAPSAGGGDAELKAAKDLERQGQAKVIKLTGEDRRRIAAAKKAAKDAGIDWDSL